MVNIYLSIYNFIISNCMDHQIIIPSITHPILISITYYNSIIEHYLIKIRGFISCLHILPIHPIISQFKPCLIVHSLRLDSYQGTHYQGLWRLLLVHGRWNYLRVSEMILYFFYKNMVFTIPQFYYAFFCGFSGQSIFDSLYISLYNVVFTALPLIARAILEQDVYYIFRDKYQRPQKRKLSELPDDFTVRQSLKKLYPKIYYVGQVNSVFNYSNFFWWVIEAMLEGLLITLICIYSLGKGTMNAGGTNSEEAAVSVKWPDLSNRFSPLLSAQGQYSSDCERESIINYQKGQRMEERALPLLNPSVSKKLRFKRELSEPPLHSVTQGCVWLPNHDVSLIEQINKSKSKVHLKKSTSKTQQIITLQDSINQNKRFHRQLKFLLHRTRNPELIALVSDKKMQKIPRFQIEKQSTLQHLKAVETLKKKVQPKWKMYTRSRGEHRFSLRDSLINLREGREAKSVDF